jgi:hypothetical protein
MLCTHNAHAAIPPKKTPQIQCYISINSIHPTSSSSSSLLPPQHLSAGSILLLLLLEYINTSTSELLLLSHSSPSPSGGICILKWKKNHQKCKRGFEEDGWVEFILFGCERPNLFA